METIQKMLKRGGMISIIESIVFGIIGFILYAKAESATVIATNIIGIALILVGIGKMVVHWVNKEDDFEGISYEYVYGLMTIIVGIIVLRYNTALEALFRIIIGSWILYTSLIKFALTIKMRALETEAWYASLVLSIIMFAFGLLIVFNPGMIIKTVGIMMIIYAIIDIIEDIICIIKLNEIF